MQVHGARKVLIADVALNSSSVFATPVGIDVVASVSAFKKPPSLVAIRRITLLTPDTPKAQDDQTGYYGPGSAFKCARLFSFG
jgi:hypothetical protein